MGKRIELHNLLVSILGSSNVYFQPPSMVEMSYPCIVYQRIKIDTRSADNSSYLTKKRYSITVIDRNPDSDIPDKIAALPECIHDRQFTADNLNHDVFMLFF
jgi:hypothetical protein